MRLILEQLFQECVYELIKIIGLEVFGIKHYWARFEFAKSRGQIHLHLLGITDDAKYNKQQTMEVKKK